MEVTCERCGTVYDFDDALVSERGTSVKCTTCGHQFKVRRAAAGTGGPDTWIVRTVDGREIEFSALRELQSSIHDGKISRDDVLVRGNSRPRRLGSIAELEPFFNRIGMTVPGTGTTPPPPMAGGQRTRTRTPAGLGGSAQNREPPQRTESSVVFALPGGQRAAQAPQPPQEAPAPVAMGQALLGKRPASVRPPAMTNARSGEGAMPAAPRVPGGLEDLNTIDAPPPPRATTGSQPMFPDDAPISTRNAPPPRTTTGSSPSLDDRAPISNRSGMVVERISALPPPPPPPRPKVGSAPLFPPAEAPPPPRKQASSAPMFPPTEPSGPPPLPRKQATSAPMFPPAEAPEPPPPRKQAASQPAIADAPPSSGEDPTLMMDRAPTSEGPTLMMDRPPALTPAKPAPPKPPPPKPPPPKAAPAEPADKPEAAVEQAKTTPPPTRAPTSDPNSLPLSSPASSLLRDDPYSEARTSGPAPRRPTASRWIVGVVLVGLAAFGAVTVGRKYLPGGAATATQEDARLGILIEQGDRDLKDGDLDAANESYVKASALAEKDTRVAVRLARLAAVRADVTWLKVRVLPASDPDLLNAKRELDIAVGRAKTAAEKAYAIAPEDVDVTRCRIDALRLTGDLEGARKLVASLPKSTPQPNDELLFATLDLAEASPGWPTVIERLKSAARDEQNLGRARSMLVYALAKSGDAAGAKAELDRLTALPRPHPLASSLRAFVAAQGAGDTKKPGETTNGVAGDDPLAAVTDAINKSELDRAETLLKELADKSPNDAKVLKAQGDLAMAKHERATATRLYDKAVAADGKYLPALAALADIKWDNKERQTAARLYRQIIEIGGPATAYAPRAKERLDIFVNTVPDFE